MRLKKRIALIIGGVILIVAVMCFLAYCIARVITKSTESRDKAVATMLRPICIVGHQYVFIQVHDKDRSYSGVTPVFDANGKPIKCLVRPKPNTNPKSHSF